MPMPVHYKIKALLVSLMALTVLAQCAGKKNKADGVKVSIFPEKPIVITGSIGDIPEKQAPWFEFVVNIENTTEYSFTIVALQAEVTAQDASGNPTTVIRAWDPSGLNYTLDSLACNYGNYGTWAPGESKELQVGAGAGCLSGIVSFPSGGYPTGLNGNNFRYRVRLKPLGYFIDGNGNPDDRLEKFKYFFTQ